MYSISDDDLERILHLLEVDAQMVEKDFPDSAKCYRRIAASLEQQAAILGRV